MGDYVRAPSILAKVQLRLVASEEFDPGSA
ncbi:hypothetical protein CCACVL1_03180 [Corchorus capsularis]|uniref:Uncharacterized protein n=1 Tax=Corchorus capsularis TaxID=210143 RepID=A0A1R3K1V2_COCAP|nr:hypothetical protein CCACVL1_03180 [Corchorus capsularis]